MTASHEGYVRSADGQTRDAVLTMLLEHGPVTAGEIGSELGISAAGVRRHLDALMASGEVSASATSSRYAPRTRGRPAKRYQLTAAGRGRFRHAYDDLAGAVMQRLRVLVGDQAITDFARDRIEGIVAQVDAVERCGDADEVAATADQIADALTGAGFSASTRRVGTGVQICAHHCPVAHVAGEFPELCEAETVVFTELLGTPVQRLATIANGDCACTTHVPLVTAHRGHSSGEAAVAGEQPPDTATTARSSTGTPPTRRSAGTPTTGAQPAPHTHVDTKETR
ncbi:transcriptional regulator [Gordonia jinhuaensis]|uniref:Transcriptional regulator n=1 Tax=Gordonia jinhuaensis TaxID=1517702 RepID=A0A916T0E6_9ACTN|nr:transcriptional regulator [Gordonia jinhuaensis]